MEYTKDMILGVRYNEINKMVNKSEKGWKNRLVNKIKMHKVVTSAVISAIVFVSIDAVLITNFIHILSLI